MLDLFWPGIEPVSADEHRNVGLIESALARPVQTFGGEFLIQGNKRQGAALFHSLIANHPFENGNKRTAVMALDLFFTANGYWLALDPDAVHDLAVSLTFAARGPFPPGASPNSFACNASFRKTAG